MEELDNSQPDVLVKRNVNVFAIVATMVITALLVGGGVYLWQNSILKSTKLELQDEINQLRDQVEAESVLRDESTAAHPTEETMSDSNWEKHSGQGFYKFSISAPKNSYVCIGETATGGSHFGCWPEGVYLEDMKHFPYGIEFEQTGLAPDLQNLVDVFGYEDYTKSDIRFGDADNQIMVTGSETRKFWDRNNNEFEKTVYFTKYLFTKDGLVYMPKIYTDLELNNYNLYKEILKTWTFE